MKRGRQQERGRERPNQDRVGVQHWCWCSTKGPWACFAVRRAAMSTSAAASRQATVALGGGSTGRWGCKGGAGGPLSPKPGG